MKTAVTLGETETVTLQSAQRLKTHSFRAFGQAVVLSVAGLGAAGCVVESVESDDFAAGFTSGEGKIALNQEQVPVLEQCGEGLFVRRTTDGWTCTPIPQVVWGGVGGVPDGFQDEIDNDILGTLGCLDGEIPVFSESRNDWLCGGLTSAEGGDITGVDVGAGLLGGGQNGAVSIAVAFGTDPGEVASGEGLESVSNRVGSLENEITLSDIRNCIAGTSPVSDGTGAWACAVQGTGNGDITSVEAGPGLTGGAPEGNAVLAVHFGEDPDQVARGTDLKTLREEVATQVAPIPGLTTRLMELSEELSRVAALAETVPTLSDRLSGLSDELGDVASELTLTDLPCEAGQMLAATDTDGWACVPAPASGLSSVTASIGLSGFSQGDAVALAVDFGDGEGQAARGASLKALDDLVRAQTTLNDLPCEPGEVPVSSGNNIWTCQPGAVDGRVEVRWTHLAADAFFPTSTVAYATTNEGRWAAPAPRIQDSHLSAAINLPHGATVTEIRCLAVQTDASRAMTAAFKQHTIPNTAADPLAVVNLFDGFYPDGSPDLQALILRQKVPEAPRIDNENNYYRLRVTACGQDCIIHSCRIRYQVDSPYP